MPLSSDLGPFSSSALKAGLGQTGPGRQPITRPSVTYRMRGGDGGEGKKADSSQPQPQPPA